MRRVATCVFALTTVALVASMFPQPAVAADAPADRVVVMYFHRVPGCATCQKMAAYSEEAVKKGFAKRRQRRQSRVLHDRLRGREQRGPCPRLQDQRARLDRRQGRRQEGCGIQEPDGDMVEGWRQAGIHRIRANQRQGLPEIGSAPVGPGPSRLPVSAATCANKRCARTG